MLLLVLAITACGGGKPSKKNQQPEAEGPVTLKLGHIGSLENEYNLMAEKFKAEVETENGRQICYPDLSGQTIGR